MYTNCCSYFLATLYFSIWSHFDKSPSLVLSFYITCSFISLSTSISLSFINLHKQSFFLSINPPTYYFPFLKSCLTFTRKYNITSLSLSLTLFLSLSVQIRSLWVIPNEKENKKFPTFQQGKNVGW